jgi:hypothetical protein
MNLAWRIGLKIQNVVGGTRQVAFLGRGVDIFWNYTKVPDYFGSKCIQ